MRSDFTNWAKDSFLLLPSMIKTDVPFLLSRIFLNAAVTTSGENLGRYEFETIGVGEYPFVISFLNMLTQICALTGKSNQLEIPQHVYVHS